MKKISYIILGTSLLFTGCKDLLDRPELTKVVDSENTYWRNDNDLRLYANDFYTNYFVGYNSGYGVDYTPLRSYDFADDFTSENLQASLLGAVPTTGTGGSNSATPAQLRAEHPGPAWNFYWVRKSNIMLDRLENDAKTRLTDEEFKHWSAVARFFRGFEYSRLVSNFGDVPYYSTPVAPDDFDQMYKDRDKRVEVMDKVYEDFQYTLQNMRLNDGSNYLNRYVAAALISNMMLFEGSWMHYHNVDPARAKKFLELSRDAAQFVMDSGKWSFGSTYKDLFVSENLALNSEVIFHRVYDAALGIRHAIASYSNGRNTQLRSANLNLLKSFIRTDGTVAPNPLSANASEYRMQNLAKTRDSRLEATFMDTVYSSGVGTLVYAHKFCNRGALEDYVAGKVLPAQWDGSENTSDAPIVRLAEVVLNWVEAKQILAEFYGGAAVTQADINKSINAIRNRPLDATAVSKGVQKTAPLSLSALPTDPSRDADVSPLMWEIRRERRMEFVFEYARIQDIRRWKKLNYLNFSDNTYKLGAWVIGVRDFGNKANPGKISDTYKNRLQVMKADGTIVTYNGTNDADMVGFYVARGFANRLPVQDRNYLSPLALPLIQAYKDRGYTIKQTPGWE